MLRKANFATELSEEMIQHIQSFLNAKEAARTTILSKLWYRAWLTRPNLDFSERDFHNQADFVKVMKRTLERYEGLKLRIDRFELLLKNVYDENCSFISMAVEWTKKAMKLGASDVHINIGFVLPGEVFESESLVRLSFSGGIINAQEAPWSSCSTLKSLNLHGVYVEGNILDIISICPLIEELDISFCEGSDSDDSDSRLMLVSNSGLDVNYFHNLKVLSLHEVEIREWLFYELSKSPYLKEFSLFDCAGFEEIQICSNSLECIHISGGDELRISRAKFDVPQIRKFEFEGCSRVPSLCFKTCSREWKSIVSFHLEVDSSRFVKLRKFLSELSSSKIYLDLLLFDSRKMNEEAENVIGGLPQPAMVEKLGLELMEEPLSVKVLKDLFCSCRPKVITVIGEWDMNPYKIMRRICKTVIKQDCKKGKTSPLHDLEKVDVKIPGHTAWSWSRGHPLPDASKFRLEFLTKICLQWR